MIRKFEGSDREKLCDFFANLLEKHLNYISHGELQMGLAIDEQTLAPNYKDIWHSYLDRQVDNGVEIMIYEKDSRIEGFIMFEIDSDNAEPYGVISDMGVNEKLRGCKIGSELIEVAIERLKSQNISSIYLESGQRNHSAHNFFEKFGFKHVSNIYRAKI